MSPIFCFISKDYNDCFWHNTFTRGLFQFTKYCFEFSMKTEH